MKPLLALYLTLAVIAWGMLWFAIIAPHCFLDVTGPASLIVFAAGLPAIGALLYRRG